MALGLTNGTNNFGGRLYAESLSACSNDYGRTLPNTSNNGSYMGDAKLFGITTDETKSGIIADTSSLTLICNMIIKF